MQILIKVSIIVVIIYDVTSFQCWSLNFSSSWSAYISFCISLTKLSFWFERCEKASELPATPCSMLDDSLIDSPCSSSGSGSSKRVFDEVGLLSFYKYEIETIALWK